MRPPVRNGSLCQWRQSIMGAPGRPPGGRPQATLRHDRRRVQHRRREGLACLRAEELQERPHRAARQDQADEEQDRAERLVPAQVHEVEDDEHELHGGEDDERRDQDPLHEGQVDRDELEAR